MIYERRYIQFNDLIFDSFDMISDWDGSLSFKGSSTAYSYGHGAYRPYKRNYLYVNERQVSMTITLLMDKLPCEFREFYGRFAMEELAKPGKLWCIKNGELLWAYASVDNISENFAKKNDRLVYNINFVIPGGIWYKADKQKTFLVPWNICDFMECMGYRKLQPCTGSATGDCCDICEDKKIAEREDCSCCCDDQITADMALCYHDDLQSFYSCFTEYRVVYDCNHAEKFNKDEFLGQKLCVNDGCESALITGQIYSETEIPTEDVTIIIKGKMKNPIIDINGNVNIIKGEYEGVLTIRSNGDVYYSNGLDSDCYCEELLDPSVWSVPSGNEYGWTIYPKNNRVIVNLNDCCQGRACLWIQHEAIGL